MKKNASHSSHTLRRVLTLLKPCRLLILLSFVLAAGSVLFTLYLPILIGNAVDCLIGPGSVDFSGLFRILLTMGICIAAAAVCQWFMNLCNNAVTFRTVRDLRIRAFRQLEQLPLSYLDAQQSGDLLSRMVTDAEQLSDGLLMGFTQLFTGVLTIAGTLFFMLRINPVITLVVAALTPATFLIAKFVTSRTHALFQKQSITRGQLTGLTTELISGIRVVKAFGHEEQAIREFDEINTELEGHSLKATFFSSLTNPTTRFANAVIYAGVTLFGCLACLPGGHLALTVGQLTSFLSYTSQYAKPFNEITGVVTEFQNALASAERIFELLDQDPILPDASDAKKMTHPVGNVSLEHVDFSYIQEHPLIRDLNLTVRSGQRIAIVGPTGCGKTTLINLLMRYYETDAGSILVDDQDITSLTRESLRSCYGMVLQDTWLKAGTIRENISYGYPEATEEEVIRAAKEAHADSFIRRMPNGYDTVIGEDGGALSQGQKQLLCIARIMLHLPPMLILDEATSSIDTRTEILVQQAFHRMMQGRTSFIVAHRLSTIREADVILVMKDGHILEQGDHESLLEKGGFYATLYNSQWAAEE